MCQGLNSHYFHILGYGHEPNSKGLYTHYIRIPIKGGMTIPNIATFDHGTVKFPGGVTLLFFPLISESAPLEKPPNFLSHNKPQPVGSMTGAWCSWYAGSKMVSKNLLRMLAELIKFEEHIVARRGQQNNQLDT